MKRNNPPSEARNRKKTTGRIRLIIFTLLFVLCTVALGLSGVKPFDRFRASAQQQPDKPLVDKSAATNAQGGEEISESARQQISALMQEKANRTPGQKKMDSRLIYASKMGRGERVAIGVDTLDVGLDIDEEGKVIIDITAEVNASLLSKLKIAGAKIITSVPQYRTVQVRVSIDAVETIANYPEVIYVQSKQDPIFWQEPPSPDNKRVVDPDHLSRTRPGFEERERIISKKIALALNNFQLDSYTSANGGVRKSEADKTHKADLSRNTYGFDGTGIKIGVLSNGVRNLAAAQASGDLGPVTVLPGQSGTAAGQCATNVSCDEGTAMLELIHDLAPGAELFYATALPTSANFAQNIRNLRTAGCDIIVDDVFYFAESPFQDGQAPAVLSPTNGGIVAQAVNDVTADGALYFSSAGNSGNKNDGTSGVWEGDFVDGGDAPAPIGAANGRLHTFPADGAIPAQNFNSVTASGGPLILNWSDPLGGSNNDYDLFVLNSTGTTVLAASNSTQSGTQDPLELVNATLGASLRIVVVKYSGAARFLHVSLSRGRISVNTPGISSGHSSGALAYSVAATPAIGPFPSPFSSSNVVETFSSDGPRKLFFQGDGTPFTPGDLLATGGITRQKPDITAADGASVTGAGGFGIQFFGTSAAAPHAAAMAGLLKSANPGLTPAQVRTALTSTAIDIEAPGTDRDSGVGIIMADASMASIGAVAGAASLSLGTVTTTDIGGNLNGYIEPGERGTLNIPLLNTGINPATTVTATLSSTTPGVVITPSPTRGYPDIPATSGTSTNATPFEFVLQESATYGTNIAFVLTVTYNGITRPFPFTIPTGQLALISGVLDTTANVDGTNYTAATGQQTGRLNFTFPISTCGSTKTNPGPTSALLRRYDSYTFTNTSLAPICATIVLTHSANALIHAVAYVPTFTQATPAVGYAGDGGGSTTSGAGTAQLFSITVPASSTFTVVVSESNQNGGLNVPYNLRVTGLPAAAVPANQPPVNTVPGAQVTNEDTALVFTGPTAISTSDPDAGGSSVQVTLTATNGSFSLGGTTGLTFTPPGAGNDGTNDTQMIFTGSISDINTALNNLSFTPSPDFNGPASLAIATNDQGFTGTGGSQSDSDTINITVNAVNDPPSFTKGPDQSVPEDSPAQTVPNWATAISPGPADESVQTLNFLIQNNTNPGLFSAGPDISSTGTLTYTPTANTTGTATVTIALMDSGGGTDTSASQTFDISVTDVNDPPSFTKGPDQTVAEDAGAQSVPNWATSISPGEPSESAQTLTFLIQNNTDTGLFSSGPAISSTGTLTYTPAANATGSATITIALMDNGGGTDTSPSQTFVINVNAVNDVPSFTKGPDQTVAEDAGAQSVPNWATAISPGAANESGQTLTFLIQNNTNPGLFSAGPAISSTGTLTYTPAAGVSGSATITIAFMDNGGGTDTSASQTFVINVTAVNDPPSFTKGPDQTVAEDSGAQSVPNWATAISPGPADESGQTVTFLIQNNTNPGLFSAGPAISSTGALTYTPATNAVGSATITIALMDNGGGTDTSASQTFVINVTAVNDPASFAKGPDQTVAEDSGAQSVPNWATAISPGPADESGQTLTFLIQNNTNPGLFSAGPAISSTGTLTYTPTANTSGSATITIALKDNGGGSDTSASQTFVITVTEVNDAPTAVSETLPDVSEDSGQQVIPFATLTANDSKGPANESGQTLIVKTVGNAVGGTVSISGGNVLFTPTANYEGPASFDYTIEDNGTTNGVADPKTSGTATASFAIVEFNDAPTAVNDTLANIVEDFGPRAIPFADLTGNDSKGPANESGQTLTVVNVSSAVGGTVFLVPGFVVFTPTDNYNGPASFNYIVQDNGTTNGVADPKTSGTASAQFTITDINDVPTTVNDTLSSVAEDSGERSIAFADLTGNDSAGPANESGQTLFVKAVSNPVGVTVSIVGGTVRITPLPDYNGPASFHYTVQDNGTTSGSPDPKISGPALVQFNVTAVNNGVLRFSAGNYSVVEGAGFKTITVERSGDTSQAVTVEYASSDHGNPADFIACTSPGAGLASSRCDFTTAIGSLRFAAGETSKTFNVLITNDNYVEGAETLQLALANPTNGAVLGVPQTAILSITDDATEPATNPIDNAADFVRAQYHDILGREPDAAGLAFWTDNIEKCTDPARRPAGLTVEQCVDKQRESTAIAFFQSPEFQMTGGFVYNLYKGSLTGSPNYDGGSAGRFPTFLEFMHDKSQVSEGILVNGQISGAVVEANRNALAAAFVERPEFIAKYGGLNNTQYVNELFNTTGIVPTAAQKQTLIDNLTNAIEDRASVLRKVVDGTVVINEGNVQFTTTYGQAFINQENNRLFVYLEYIGYLRRNPDQAGFAFWLGKLNQFNGDPIQAEMVKSFILSPEYRNRFGQP